VFALLSIGDLLGVILAVLFGLLGAALIYTGLASWRGYVIAGLIVHVLVAAYRVALLHGWLQEARASGQGDMPAAERPNPVRLRLQALSDWTQSPLLQTIFGSVSCVGLVSVLYLRPTIPWKYSVDIPLMILLACAIAAAEYAFLPVSWRAKRHQKRQQSATEPEQTDSLRAEDQNPVEHPDPVEAEPGGELITKAGDTVQGVVVEQPRPLDDEATNQERLNKFERRLIKVENSIFQHERDASAPSALESGSAVWFDGSDSVRAWATSDELATGVVSIELLSVARLTSRQEGCNAKAGRVVGITIERRTVPIPPEPGETISQVTTQAAETFSQEIETYVSALATARLVSPPGWGVVSEHWVKVGSAGVSTAARTVTEFGAYLDSILDNKPVPRAFSWEAPGSPGSAAALLGRNAETKHILHLGGIVVGTRSGQPVAIRASFRSPGRDEFTRSLAAGIARELGTIGLSRAPAPSSMHRQAG
jgi:hypothetical protein